jgi:hypothetical protein
MAAQLSIEEIQYRAYQIWLSEGCPQGRDKIHWIRAEAEFRERLARQNACRTGFHGSPPATGLNCAPNTQGERQLLTRQ